MTHQCEYFKLKDLLLATRDGDWGKDSPEEGHVAYRVIRGTDFPAARIGKVSTIPIRYLPERTATRRTLEPGDILIETAGGAKDRPTGRALFVSEWLLDLLCDPATCASFSRFLRIDKRKADPRFIFWYLQYLHQNGTMWQYQIQHTGIARFQFTHFASTHGIPLPPLGDQTLIADLLGSLDDKIAINAQIASTTRDLAQAHFGSAIKQTGYRQIALKEATRFLARGITPRYTDDGNGLLIVNQRCVRDGRTMLTFARRTKYEKVSSQKLLQSNDILVNSTGVGTLGRVARWTASDQATVDSHVTIVRFDPDRADPVCGGFAMLAAQPEIERLGEGSTGQTELSKQKLGELQLDLPEPDTAGRLRPLLDSLEASGDSAMTQNLVLGELRDTLLPKLISGELRIRDADKVVEDAV